MHAGDADMRGDASKGGSTRPFFGPRATLPLALPRRISSPEPVSRAPRNMTHPHPKPQYYSFCALPGRKYPVIVNDNWKRSGAARDKSDPKKPNVSDPRLLRAERRFQSRIAGLTVGTGFVVDRQHLLAREMHWRQLLFAHLCARLGVVQAPGYPYRAAPFDPA